MHFSTLFDRLGRRKSADVSLTIQKHKSNGVAAGTQC